MIEGLNIRCNVGPVEILRSPFLELVFRRCAVLSRATVHVPDPEGEVRSRLAVGQAVAVRWGYRGEAGMWQEWEGPVGKASTSRAGMRTARTRWLCGP